MHHPVMVQDASGRWVPAVPLPLMLAVGRKACHCGTRHLTRDRYEAHYLVEHIAWPQGLDVYPVGLLADLLSLRRYLTRHGLTLAVRRNGVRHALYGIRRDMRRVVKHVRAGAPRDARNVFNGYLAEPTNYPGPWKRCGRGWTKRAALRRLGRHLLDERRRAAA